MNLKELKKQVDILVKNNRGDDLEVVVQTQGIGGPSDKVEHISFGFDWYAGKAVIVTENFLSTVKISEHSKLKKLYLYQVSNLDKIEKGKTLTAKFKKKENEFTSKLSAAMWLYKQVDAELE